MQKKYVRAVAIAISVLMTLSVLAGVLYPIVYASETEELQERLELAQNNLDNLGEELDRIEDEIASIEQSKQNTYAELKLLDTQIANLTEQISIITTVIDGLTEDIAVQEQLLEAAEKALLEQYELYKTRMRVMYEAGEASTLEILFSSDDFFDMLSKVEITNQIMEYDKNLYHDFQENVRLVEEAKAKLEADKAAQEEHKADLDASKASLESSVSAAEQMIKSLVAKQEESEEAQAEMYRQEELAAQAVAQLARELASSKIYVGGDFGWPLPMTYTDISSPYGYRTHPVTGVKNSFHYGTDFPAPGGTPIYTANTGEVIIAQFNSSYGYYVAVDHGGGKVTLYAHMSQMACSVGDTVVKGETIGYVGTTGSSTGNHLHYEIRINGEQVDPMSYYGG